MPAARLLELTAELFVGRVRVRYDATVRRSASRIDVRSEFAPQFAPNCPSDVRSHMSLKTCCLRPCLITAICACSKNEAPVTCRQAEPATCRTTLQSGVTARKPRSQRPSTRRFLSFRERQLADDDGYSCGPIATTARSRCLRRLRSAICTRFSKKRRRRTRRAAPTNKRSVTFTPASWMRRRSNHADSSR